MSIFTTSSHEFWGTVSGNSIEEITRQQEILWQWGVTAIEVRADLVPPDTYQVLLDKDEWVGRTCIAHFGIGVDSLVAQDVILQALRTDIAGCICHSRNESIEEISRAVTDAGKFFATAYHSQQPLTPRDALQEFEYQETLKPLFRKIAVRAYEFEDALAIIEATRLAFKNGGSPVVSAVFGTHRWARTALPSAGSAISFIVAHQVFNEEGGDDQQFCVDEVDFLNDAHILLAEPLFLQNTL